MSVGILIGVAIGATIGNFGWQAIQFHPDWGIAAERTWFQFEVLLAVGVAGYVASIIQA